MLPYWTLDKKIAKALERYQRDVAEANCVVCSYAPHWAKMDSRRVDKRGPSGQNEVSSLN